MAEKFKPCSIEGCNGNSHRSAKGARGWCRMHYKRWQRHGDPCAGRAPAGEISSFIDSALIAQTDECILWPFARNSAGYGHFMLDCRWHNAHRFICEKVHGSPPEIQYQAAHACGNRACINPRHLRWATRSENMMDCVDHGTISRGKRNGQAKLSEADVHKIRALRGKMKQREIAAIFQIGQQNVCLIQTGKSWGWLTK